MAEVIFAALDWDRGNREKCAKHGIAVEDIEHVLRNNPLLFADLKHSQKEQRTIAVGRSLSGRWMFIVFTVRRQRRGQTLVRPLSARYMHEKEVRKYE